jgi:hypothetical protein
MPGKLIDISLTLTPNPLICLSNKLPGIANFAGLWNTLWVALIKPGILTNDPIPIIGNFLNIQIPVTSLILTEIRVS